MAPDPGGAAPPRATERRLVTVLFADLVGDTALAADRDPEVVRDMPSGYFEVARERIAPAELAMSSDGA